MPLEKLVANGVFHQIPRVIGKARSGFLVEGKAGSLSLVGELIIL
jgi:hypothetical protein